MAGTYGELKSRIASEIKRADQAANIALAIGRAIEHYASRRFWFNVGRKTSEAAAGEEYVTIAAGLRQADAVYVTIGGQERELRRRPLEEIETLAGSLQASGQPTDYADFGAQIRLWPRPDAAYPVTWLGLVDLPALAADGDSNAWTDTAQDLIAARACWFINLRVLQDAEAAAASQAEEQQAWTRLQRDTALRDGDGVVEPY
jgi:hypothetical protein